MQIVQTKILLELRTLTFALSTYGIVSLLIVLISPRLLLFNALLNRLILLRFIVLSCLTKHNSHLDIVYYY